MGPIKLDYNTALLPMFMVEQAVRSVLANQGQTGLERLCFTRLEIESGVAEPQPAVTRKATAAALLQEKPHMEIVQTVLINGSMSIFNGSSLTVMARCTLYRHIYSRHDLCEPESIALTICDSEGDEGPEEHIFRFGTWCNAARVRNFEIKKEDTLNAKDKIKLAIISTEVLPDHYVKNLVLDWEITNTNDLEEIIGCLEKYRPRIARKLYQVLKNKSKK